MRSLMQQTVFEIKYEMLCERTRHRQRAAKADLERRRVDLCVRISSLYTPPRRKAFLSLQHRRCPVIGANDRFYVKHPRLRVGRRVVHTRTARPPQASEFGQIRSLDRWPQFE
jgi:hypothetical protein